MLDDAVKAELSKTLQRLKSEGTLLSQPQLDQYYATFRARFGSEQSASLDGEELLERMHAHGGRDSLV
jgi:5-methylcytosine-specific restriction enzyme B